MLSAHDAWRNLTENGDNIVIVTHPTPDGDALGSAFGLALALDAAGKRPMVMLDRFSAKYDFLVERRFVLACDDALPDFDVLVAVDCGDKSRVWARDGLLGRPAVTINIDHHVGNDNFANHNYVDTSASSTCQVIYEIIQPHVAIGKEIAAALYAGIVTDTGAFRHSGTTPRTMEIAGALMSAGIDFGRIQRETIHARTRIETEIFAKAIQNIRYTEGYPIAHTFVSPEEMAAVGAKITDLDGIVEYVLNVEGISVAAFFTQRSNGMIKVSLRSSGVDVNAIAGQFGGGGHKFAAAAQFAAPLEEGRREVIDVIKTACDKWRQLL
ncbi:MAG: bifunctional oligoribonuclease/PAP phosphatase NrnA [Defluviitaleaceae bacterium]|nr:bifunctional oligoribonuclease/PAP phosphatase NrnA [Defluviitaleaceae bacterium]